MEPQAPISVDGTDAETPKICGSCGTRFGCGADAGSCWCFEVELDPSAAMMIGRSFADCLCRQCLAKYNESSAQKAD